MHPQLWPETQHPMLLREDSGDLRYPLFAVGCSAFSLRLFDFHNRMWGRNHCQCSPPVAENFVFYFNHTGCALHRRGSDPAVRRDRQLQRWHPGRSHRNCNLDDLQYQSRNYLSRRNPLRPRLRFGDHYRRHNSVTATAAVAVNPVILNGPPVNVNGPPANVNGPPVNVLTWHYDNQRSGLNPNETTLTTANVNAADFGKLFSDLVDGYIYAQPLYVSALTIAGALHNVVFVATEKDSVYAFDADSYGPPLWQVSLLQPGETPPSGSIKPYQGITSTPVIDLASNTLYVVSAQVAGSQASYRLHALDLLTGAEKFGGPVPLTATVPGTNSDSVNGLLSLPTNCVQRAALLLANSTVYIGFASCHSGWLLAYDAQTLAQSAAFAVSPDANGYGNYGGAGGIWMGGGGPAADSSGSIYVSTGNGPYDGVSSFADSVLRFDARLNLLDHFTPGDWTFLQCHDSDLASGGLLLLPGSNYALAGGKLGKMYLLSTSNLGGITPNDTGAAQSLWFEQGISSVYSTPYSATCTDNQGVVLTDEITGYQIYGTAAFFNNSVYLGVTPSTASDPGPVRQFTFSGNNLTPASATSDSIAADSYGTTPFISANGSSSGIVWVLSHGTADSGS